GAYTPFMPVSHRTGESQPYWRFNQHRPTSSPITWPHACKKMTQWTRRFTIWVRFTPVGRSYRVKTFEVKTLLAGSALPVLESGSAGRSIPERSFSISKAWVYQDVHEV